MIFSSKFSVGSRTCEMNVDTEGKGPFEVIWTPMLDHSPAQDLTAIELDEYRQGRNNLMTSIGKFLGGPVLMVEI